MAQLSPCVLAGAAIAAAAARLPELIVFLPGLWAMLFGLGLIAARPYLPASIGTVGLGYAVPGATILFRTVSSDEPSGWAVGLAFGLGHLTTASVLVLRAMGY